MASGSPRGIQSVEVGGRLLLALVDAGRPMALKELAQASGMAPPKAHPYLVSFGKLGLIVQNEVSGRYGLGPLAVQLGLISLQQIDSVRLASEQLAALAAELGQTAAIAVWGNRGATVVRTEAGPAPLHVGLRHGTVMSLEGTASGKLFAAWLPRAEVLAAEPGARFDDAFERELERVRTEGLARAVDAAVAGVSALAAPVFDAAGRLVLALTVIGPGAGFDVGPGGQAAVLLKARAETLSGLLGAPVAEHRP